MRMNNQTKLVFELEDVAHLLELIEGNEWEHHLKQSLVSLEVEFERQLDNEIERKRKYHHDV